MGHSLWDAGAPELGAWDVVGHFGNSLEASIEAGLYLLCCSVTKSCPTLCESMDCSIPGIPVLHYLPEFAQNHVPLSWRCHPTISSSVAPFSCLQSFPASGSFPESALHVRQPEYWSFSFSISPSSEFRIDWFDLLAVKGLSRVFSSTIVQKHQFFGTQPSLWSNSHIHT